MKKNLLLLLTILSSLFAFSQVDSSKDEKETDIFTLCEKMPEYPGGKDALNKFLCGNVNYPEQAKESGITGKVIVNFIVEKDGKITDVKVLHGLGGGCDEEAVRVVQNMPDWVPGQQRGKAVRVSYNLPITFNNEKDCGSKSKKKKKK